MAARYGNIVGWGKYIPEKTLTNFDLEKIVDTSDEWITQRTGIKERHIVNAEEHTSTMATAAARQALEMAQILPSQLDLIIVATSSMDYLMPPVSSQIQDELGAKGVGAFTLVNGCSGFVYALATAQQFISSGAANRVLVIGAEVISRWVDWEDRATCVLFGDGAGAVVLEASDQPSGLLSHVLGSDGAKYQEIWIPGGGTRTRAETDGSHLEKSHVHMNGREVFKFATRIMGRSIREALELANLSMEDIDLFIPHQANKRIIDHAAKQLKLPKEKVFVNIHKYGNTSAASVPIALVEALEEGRAKLGDTLALVAFGAGLTWAAAIVKLAERTNPPPPLRWWEFGALWERYKLSKKESTPKDVN